jgi:hypothetical protein
MSEDNDGDSDDNTDWRQVTKGRRAVTQTTRGGGDSAKKKKALRVGLVGSDWWTDLTVPRMGPDFVAPQQQPLMAAKPRIFKKHTILKTL